MERRKRRYNVARKYNSAKSWRKYIKLQKLVKSEIKSSYERYVSNIFTLDGKSKKLWTFIKSLKRDKVGVPPLVVGDKLFDSAVDKANALLSQYSSVFTIENDNMPIKDRSVHKSMDKIIMCSETFRMFSIFQGKWTRSDSNAYT